MNNYKTIGAWIGGSIIVGIATYIYWVGPSVLWYALRYRVTPAKVYVDAVPTDCGFWHAPLGPKGCHYERLVTGYSAKSSLQYDTIFVSWVKRSD
jgi:hypothetical protein